MREIHEIICDYHSRSWSMANRIIRARYFRPTMVVENHEYVKKCIPCKKHDNITHIK